MSETAPNGAPPIVADTLPPWFAQLRWAAIVVMAIFLLSRFIFLVADFPPNISWDGDILTDEGLYTGDAINYVQEGHWYLRTDFNQALVLPVWQFFAGAAFKLFGMDLLVLRLLHMAFALGLIGLTYLVARQFASTTVALLAALLLSINHMYWAFSRIAYAEIPAAFFVMLAILLACHIRGRLWWLYGILTAVVFAIAIMTKTSSAFAAPVVAGIVISRELDWKKILAKFVVCSVVFFAIMAVYRAQLLVPYANEVAFFFSLNVGVGSTLDPFHIYAVMCNAAVYANKLDHILWFAFLPLTIFLMVKSPEYRRSGLLWLCLGYIFMYLLLYGYYGRFWPRYFPTVLPALALWGGLTLDGYFRLPVRFRPIAYAAAAVFLAGGLFQTYKVGTYLANLEDTYGEMAADIKRIMEEDPENTNNVLIGHIASSIALRTGAVPRNDRYGIVHMEERIAEHKPRYWVSEGDSRVFPMERYHRHREHFERHFHIETVARYTPLHNYRGAPIMLYRMIPRDPADIPLEHDIDEGLEHWEKRNWGRNEVRE